MQKKDFTKDVYHHDSGLAYSEEVPDEVTCNHVGWLGDSTPSGDHEIPHGFLDILHHYKNYHYVDAGWMGFHTCEICEQFDDRGEFLIQMDDDYYVLPNMVFHYIEKHDYRPHLTFMNKVMRDWASPSRNRCREDSCGIDINERSKRLQKEHLNWMKDHNEKIERIRKGEIKEDLDFDMVRARIFNVCVWGSPDESVESLSSYIIERRSGFMSGKELWLHWIKRLAEDDQLLGRFAESTSFSKEQWLYIMKKLTHNLSKANTSCE